MLCQAASYSFGLSTEHAQFVLSVLSVCHPTQHQQLKALCSDANQQHVTECNAVRVSTELPVQTET